MALNGETRYRRYYTTKIGGSEVWIDYVFEWERTGYSIVNNTSTINWTFKLDFYDSSYGTLDSADNEYWSVTIDNKTYTGIPDNLKITGTGEALIASGTDVIAHNTDGTKAFTYTFGQRFRVYDGANGEPKMASGSEALDALPKAAAIISATDFTDEGNPTITYESSTHSALVSLQACISFDGSNDDIAYRDIYSSRTTYTFNLTGSERSVLWSRLDQGTNATVRFYVKSVFENGEEFYSYVTGILTFVNYKPVLTATVVDANSDTLRLTGDENTLVRYMSTAYYTINGVARKGATIASQSVRNGDTYTGPSGMIENVYSNTFYFEVTDSRGYTTNDAVVFNNLNNRKWIEYVKLTCGFTTEAITAEGDLVVHVSGKYFGGSFGAASNKLTLEYSFNSNEGDSVSWTYVNNNNGIIEPTVNGENYTYTFTIPGLDYNKTYELSLRASDELTTGYTITKVVSSANTLFDWGKTDFNFNIPVLLNRGYMYPQTLLWQGVAQLGAGETITLDYPISEQPTGVVLVFSLYRDGAAVDASLQSFFVPRVEVQYLLPDCRHNFILGINSNFSVFGAKYLTIGDTSISGFEGNTNSGTASGSSITFNNSNFVLRYVIGV